MAGRQIQTTDAEGKTTQYVYDDLDRMVKTIMPFDGDSTSYVKTYYDKNSNPTQRYTQLSDNIYDYRYESFTYDNMNNMTSEYKYSGIVQMRRYYWYDVQNNVIAMLAGSALTARPLLQSATGNITRYEYDVNGYLTKETDALGNTVSYTRDRQGNALTITDKNGNLTTNVYGAYGIKTETTTGIGATEKYTYTYNSLGNITSKHLYIADALKDTVSYQYDAFGRMISETNNNVTTQYSYDTKSNLTEYTVTAPNSVSETYTYAYDELGRRTEENILGKSITYSYTPNGRIAEKNADGIISDYAYNDAGFVTSLSIRKGSTSLNDFQYTYSKDGNILTEIDSVNNTNKTYTYDNVGQLIKEVQTGAVNKTYSYSYDSIGNRTKKVEGGITTSYTYDANNQLTSESTKYSSYTKNTAYDYDNSGNMITKTVTQTNSSDVLYYDYGYNMHNQLTTYISPTANAVYEYNANGLRKSKKLPSSITYFGWSGDKMTAETKGSTTNVYGYGTDGIAVGRINGDVETYIKNAHGDVVSTYAGSKLNRKYKYEAFGEIISETNDVVSIT